jgi:hypothetical protein
MIAGRMPRLSQAERINLQTGLKTLGNVELFSPDYFTLSTGPGFNANDVTALMMIHNKSASCNQPIVVDYSTDCGGEMSNKLPASMEENPFTKAFAEKNPSRLNRKEYRIYVG